MTRRQYKILAILFGCGVLALLCSPASALAWAPATGLGFCIGVLADN